MTKQKDTMAVVIAVVQEQLKDLKEAVRELTIQINTMRDEFNKQSIPNHQESHDKLSQSLASQKLVNGALFFLAGTAVTAIVAILMR